MAQIESHHLFIKLAALNLSTNDFAVFGSGPMFANGIKQTLNDLDLIARNAAWEKAAQISAPQEAELGGKVITLYNGLITIFDSWLPGKWNIDQLIEDADVIAGIRFVQLPSVLLWKEIRGKDKDIADITLMRAFQQASLQGQ